MNQETIQAVRAKNIASRQKRDLRKQNRALSKHTRAESKISKMNSFADNYAAKRLVYIDKRAESINRKFAAKIDDAGSSPWLRLQKIAFRQANKRFNKRVLLLSKKLENASSDVAESLNAKLLNLREKHDSKSSAALQRIELAIASQLERRTRKEEQIRSKIDNSPFIKYYSLRLKYLQSVFNRKHKRVAKKLKIAAITEVKAEEREKRIQIDEATSYLRWDKKTELCREKARLGKTALKVQKLLDLQKNEVNAILRRKEMPPAYTALSALRDIFEIGKSNYVAGFEVRGLLNRTTSHFRKFSMYYIFAGIVIIFGIATSWTNLTSANVTSIIQNNLYVLIIGLAMLLVIVSGAIDLSVGSMLGFSGVLSVYTYNLYDANLAASVITTLLFGLGYGLFQGFLIGYFKLPSFIVTLGGMLLFSGLALYMTNGQSFKPLGGADGTYIKWINSSFESPGEFFHPASFFIIFGCGALVVTSMFFGRIKRIKYGIDSGSYVSFLIKILLIIGLFAALGYFISFSFFALKYYMIYLLVIVVLFMFMTQNTTFGRAIYAVGGNKKAAFLSGINVARTQMLVFGLIGLMTSFAGLAYTAISESAASTVGTGFELDVISSVFVGGASMSGGVGTIPGTLIGGLTLGFINNGIILLNQKNAIQLIIRAIILVSAVGYDVYSHRKIG